MSREIFKGTSSVIAERMLSIFGEVYKIDDLLLHVTASIGITVLLEDGPDYKTSVYHAVQALYKAKEARNQYVFYDEF